MSQITSLITGANTGIGFETARQLAAMGHTLVLACRDEQRGVDAVKKIRQDTGNCDIHLLLCDLASQASIRKAAADFKGRFGQLHVLINNAAMYSEHYSVTEDGIETQFAVNFLGPFLLTNLLTELLVASAPARVVNVSTANHFDVSLDFDDLQSSADDDPKVVHVRSKLAIIIFTFELARRLASVAVTANTLHPGVIATNLLGQVRRIPVEQRTRAGMGSDVESLWVGAKTPVYLATSPDVAGVSGCYFEDCKIIESSAESRDIAKASHLWELAAKLSGLE